MTKNKHGSLYIFNPLTTIGTYVCPQPKNFFWNNYLTNFVNLIINYFSQF